MHLRRPFRGLLLTLVLGLTACSSSGRLADGGGGPSAPPPATPPPATASAVPTAAATPASTVPAPAGGYDALPAVRALRAYSVARTAAMRAGSVDVPAMLTTTTPTWLDHDRDVLATLKSRGWTLTGVARWSVLGATRLAGGQTSLRACQWDASTYFSDVRSGRPAEPTVQAWKPYDVRVVERSGVWVVDAVFFASGSCAGAR